MNFSAPLVGKFNLYIMGAFQAVVIHHLDDFFVSFLVGHVGQDTDKQNDPEEHLKFRLD